MKKHTGLIFQSRGEQFGDSTFLCRTGIGDAHKLTLWRWPILLQNNDL